MFIYSINPNDMSNLTDDSLRKLIESLNQELNKRDAAKRDEAITAFQRAYYDLKALGIIPAYQEDGNEYSINLRDWDCFYF